MHKCVPSASANAIEALDREEKGFYGWGLGEADRRPAIAAGAGEEQLRPPRCRSS